MLERRWSGLAALLLLGPAGCAWMGPPLTDDGRDDGVKLRRGVQYAVQVENATSCSALVTVVTGGGTVLQQLGPYPPGSRRVITVAPTRDATAFGFAVDRRGYPCDGPIRRNVFLQVVGADSASAAR